MASAAPEGDKDALTAVPPQFKTGESAVISEPVAVPHRAIVLGRATIHVLLEDSFTTDPKFFFGEGGLLGDDEAAASARDKYLSPDGLLSNVMFGAVLVQIAGDGGQSWNVLLDAGLGETLMPDYLPRDIIAKQRAQHQLPKTMQEHAGVKPEEVDFVIHSHLHGDHIGWNVCRADGATTGELVPTFPRARHIVQRAEWEYPSKHFACPWREDFDVKCAPLEARKMVQLVDESTPFEGCRALHSFLPKATRQAINVCASNRTDRLPTISGISCIQLHRSSILSGLAQMIVAIGVPRMQRPSCAQHPWRGPASVRRTEAAC